MKFVVNGDRKEMRITAACVLTSAQLHCMPPTTAAYAERVERYLKCFGIPATVSRTTGEITVERGSLDVKVGTDETRYAWTHTLTVADLKSEPYSLHPDSLIGQLLAGEKAAEKAMYGDNEPVVELAQFRERSPWSLPPRQFHSDGVKDFIRDNLGEPWGYAPPLPIIKPKD